MKTITLTVGGEWAHFKKPETNNNPLTFDIMPKTAFVGLIGAVLGIERADMLPLFPAFCEDFLYGVKLLNPVKKISWGFTSNTAFEYKRTPKYFEFLKSPKFQIILGLKNIRSEQHFNTFTKMVKNDDCYFSPVLGWHNCPALLSFIGEGNLEEQDGDFETASFISRTEHEISLIDTDNFRIGFERMPYYQKNFWNYREDIGEEAYHPIIYPDANCTLKANGKFYIFSNQEKWWLI